MAAHEISLREDFRRVLMAFVPSPTIPEQLWSGYAFYCMNVAITFQHEYSRVMGVPPPTLGVASIEQLNKFSKNSVTLNDILNIKNGTHQVSDVVNLIQHLEQKDKDAVRLANEELDASKAELAAEKLKLQAKTDEYAKLLTLFEDANKDNKTKLENIIAINQRLELEIKSLSDILTDTMQRKNESFKAITDFLATLNDNTDAEIKEKLDKLKDMLVGNGDIKVTAENLQASDKDKQKIAQLETTITGKDAEIARLQGEILKLNGEKTALEQSSLKVEGDLKVLLESIKVLCNTENFSKHEEELAKTLEPSKLQDVPAEFKSFLETVYPFVYCCSTIFSHWKKCLKDIERKKFDLNDLKASYTAFCNNIIGPPDYFKEIYFWVMQVRSEVAMDKIETKFNNLHIDMSLNIALQMKSKNPGSIVASELFFEVTNTHEKFQGTVNEFEKKYNELRLWLVESAYNQLVEDISVVLKDSAEFSKLPSEINFLKSKVMTFEPTDPIDDTVWKDRLKNEETDFPWLLWQHGFGSMSDNNFLKENLKIYLTDQTTQNCIDLYEKINELLLETDSTNYVETVGFNTVLEYLEDEKFI